MSLQSVSPCPPARTPAVTKLSNSGMDLASPGICAQSTLRHTSFTGLQRLSATRMAGQALEWLEPILLSAASLPHPQLYLPHPAPRLSQHHTEAQTYTGPNDLQQL